MNANNEYNPNASYGEGDRDPERASKDAGAARTSDLVRAVLRQTREETQAASTTPFSKTAERGAPLPRRAFDASAASARSRYDVGESDARANVSDSVARVLRQVRSGESGSAANASAAPYARRVDSSNYADYEIASESAPLADSPSVSFKIERQRESDSAEDAPRRKGAKKKRKGKPQSAARRNKKAKKAEIAAAEIGALTGVTAGVLASEEPEEFLASVALDPAVSPVGEPEFDALAIVAPDVDDEETSGDFLKSLGENAERRDESAEKSKEQIDFLQGKSSLERAANDAPMWLASLLLHLGLVLILALIVINADFRKSFEVVSEPGFSDEVVIDQVFDPEVIEHAEVELVDVETTNLKVESEVVEDVPDVSQFEEETAQALSVTEPELGVEGASVAEVENLLGSLTGDDLSGRGENKAAAIASGGGSEGSEKAVALALAWIAEHQLPDGSWSFFMTASPACVGQCRNSGSYDAPIAATSMALLPFLAAGNTPTTGKYKKVVAAGMNYLTTHGKETENGLSFHESHGNMYSHGLATIALCETYAMMSKRERARYRQLEYLAQSALAYVEYAQADNGGWRYSPKQAGDTSVFGWQMMALKSGQLAGFAIDNNVVRGARDFLRDVVAYEDETRYAYTGAPGGSSATDAIGLLCRLYLDWGVEEPKLRQGVGRLAKQGPAFGSPYYMYYAAQLMYNHGGDVWTKWNRSVRDKLIASQCMSGHERGSWFPDNADSHCQTGGRLFATSLNCMILEVYYRHMPLYQKMRRASNFPIDGPVVDDSKPEENKDAKAPNALKESEEPKEEADHAPSDGNSADASNDPPEDAFEEE